MKLTRVIFLERGVLLRLFCDLSYTMPPYVTDDDDLARVAAAVVAATRADARQRRRCDG